MPEHFSRTEYVEAFAYAVCLAARESNPAMSALQIIDALMVGSYKTGLDGKIMISTSEGGASVSFAVVRTMDPTDQLAMFNAARKYLERYGCPSCDPEAETDQPGAASYLRADFRRAREAAR